METSRWIIRTWENRSCPADGVWEDHHLLILPDGSDACNLVWMNHKQEPELCWIEHLPLLPSEVSIPVHFGSQTTIPCVVSVVRPGSVEQPGNGLLVILKPTGKNDADAGTIAAEANGPEL
jgi:hypothetical protein